MKQDHWPHIITKSDYVRFKLAYEQGTKGITHLSSGTLGPAQGPDQCLLCETDSEDPFFSWNPCDICNRSLGGDRYIAHGITENGEYLTHMEICPDCLYYMEYGTLDDSTMERIEYEN